MRATLVSSLAASALLAASTASAVQVNFADYQGAESGNQAVLDIDGVGLTITAAPRNYDLNITDQGLGVECTAGFWRCLGNDATQIDASHGESVSLQFDTAVAVNSVSLSAFYDPIFGGPETGSIDLGGMVEILVEGSGTWLLGGGEQEVDLGGVETDLVTIRATGNALNNLSVAGIDFGSLRGGLGDVPPIVSSLPEPSAALAFAIGLLVVAKARR